MVDYIKSSQLSYSEEKCYFKCFADMSLIYRRNERAEYLSYEISSIFRIYWCS